MEEIKYIKNSNVEIQVRRIDNEVYIHQASVIDLLKDYKKQLLIQDVRNIAYCCKIWNGTTNWEECVVAVDIDMARAKVNEKYGKPMRTELLHEFDLL